MAISDSGKRRGRPSTGIGKAIALRLDPDLERRLNAWLAQQPAPRPTRPEAIRRLVERGLGAEESARQGGKKTVSKASEMAGRAIDRVDDPSAPSEDRARRKRRLLKGPSEFRAIRKDHQNR